MLNQNSSRPLYEQLKNIIKEDIDAGVYKIGDKLPSEMALEEKHNVSRITVRRAVKELCDEQILIRKQGKGTFILSQTRQNHIGQMSGFHESMQKLNKKVNTQVLEKSIVKVNSSYAKYLQIEQGDEVVFLKRLMQADGKPSLIDICYIPLKRFPDIFEKLEGNFSLFSILKNDYKVKLESFYKILSVITANKDMAEILNCHDGEALFNMFKITYDENKIPLYISVSIVRTKNTSYVISSEGQEHMSQGELTWNT